MNYQMLKSILDSIVMNFRCQDCTGSVEDKNLEMISASGTSLNLNVVCPHCGKSTLVKAEVNSVDLGSIAPDGSNLWEVKEKLANHIHSMKKQLQTQVSWPAINEKEIMDMRKKLRNENLWVNELFGLDK